MQRFRVAPQEFQREQPYIEDNIEATRRAFQLDGITTQARPLGDAVTADDIQGNQATISNIRLWRPDVLRDNFTSLQRFRSYYEFNDVDVDRYEIDGQRRVLMVSAREVSQDGIPEGGATWQNVHLVYTHGFGAVTSQVNTSTSEGQPVFTLQDIPPVGQPAFEGNGHACTTGRVRPATRRSSSSTPAPRSSTTRGRRRTIRNRWTSPTTATAASRSAACSSGRSSPGGTET